MDYYNNVAEWVNDYDYVDEPLQVTITRLRDIIELQAEQIRELEHILELQCDDTGSHRILYAPNENGHQPAHTGKSTW